MFFVNFKSNTKVKSKEIVSGGCKGQERDGEDDVAG